MSDGAAGSRTPPGGGVGGERRRVGFFTQLHNRQSYGSRGCLGLENCNNNNNNNDNKYNNNDNNNNNDNRYGVEQQQASTTSQ